MRTKTAGRSLPAVFIHAGVDLLGVQAGLYGSGGWNGDTKNALGDLPWVKLLKKNTIL